MGKIYMHWFAWKWLNMSGPKMSFLICHIKGKQNSWCSLLKSKELCWYVCVVGRVRCNMASKSASQMPGDALNATSHQMLSRHSHTDISMSMFITVDAPTLYRQWMRLRESKMWRAASLCIFNVVILCCFDCNVLFLNSFSCLYEASGYVAPSMVI